MPELRLLIGALCCMFAVSAQADEAAPLGEYRILALCLQNDAEIIAGRTVSHATLHDWEGYAERDLILVEIRKNTIHSLVGKATKQVNEKAITSWTRTAHVDSDRLRRVANCQREWDWVLIGKDTTVKKRWRNFVVSEDLYETIDAMPMRRYEMKTRSGLK